MDHAGLKQAPGTTPARQQRAADSSPAELLLSPFMAFLLLSDEHNTLHPLANRFALFNPPSRIPSIKLKGWQKS